MATLSTQMPRWTGKALGAAAALIFAPADPSALVWWLVAGIALGHGFDAILPRLGPRRPAGGTRPAAAATEAAVQFAFAALGRIGAAAEHPGARPAELQLVEELMNRLDLEAGQRQEARVWFHAGRDPSFPFDSAATAARTDLASQAAQRELVIDALCRMSALADSPAATATLLELGAGLGADRDTLALRAVAAAALLPERRAEQAACEMLGVEPDDSEEVIRLAYRRRVARWHPDRLGPDASDAELAEAQRHMWQLREALDTLLDRR